MTGPLYASLSDARDSLLLAALAKGSTASERSGCGLDSEAENLKRAFADLRRALSLANRERNRRAQSACMRIMNFIRAALRRLNSEA